MKAPHISTQAALNRRHFLKGVGSCVALPLLDAMCPAFRVQAASSAVPRFIAMNASLGFHAGHLFPEASGSDYKLTPYLEKLKDHRNDFTIFSGLSHANQNGNNGHASEMTWLTSAQRPGLAGFKNTISLDQLIARHLRGKTRVPYMALSTRGASLSWTSNGVQIPSQHSPAKLFKALFIDGTEAEVKATMRELKRGRSILDTVLGDVNKLKKSLGHRDQEKLDEYFTSLRDLEASIQQSEEWETKAKPEVNAEQPKDVEDKKDVMARQRLMYEMIALALQTDSTRTVTFDLGSMNAVPSNLKGVKTDWHNLSHHGKDEKKIEELRIIEEAEFVAFNEFLTRMKGIKDGEGNLLDHTSVLFGSNLGNASSHSWKNLPIILAGGGFKHGAHVVHDAKDNTPLANLFVPLAQRMGVETESFGFSNKSAIEGLERG